MKLKLYSVFDAKAAFFGVPVFDMNDATAVRRFSDQVNSDNPDNQWAKHPEDFSLFRVGEYDSLTGKLSGEIPECLITASSMKFGDGSPDVKPA